MNQPQMVALAASVSANWMAATLLSFGEQVTNSDSIDQLVVEQGDDDTVRAREALYLAVMDAGAHSEFVGQGIEGYEPVDWSAEHDLPGPHVRQALANRVRSFVQDREPGGQVSVMRWIMDDADRECQPVDIVVAAQVARDAVSRTTALAVQSLDRFAS